MIYISTRGIKSYTI